MEESMTLEELFELVDQLSVLDKVRLIELILPQIEEALIAAQSTAQESLPGLAMEMDTTDEDSAEAGQEVAGGQ